MSRELAKPPVDPVMWEGRIVDTAIAIVVGPYRTAFQARADAAQQLSADPCMLRMRIVDVPF